MEGEVKGENIWCGECGRFMGKVITRHKDEIIQLTAGISILELRHTPNREYIFKRMADEIVEALKQACLDRGIE